MNNGPTNDFPAIDQLGTARSVAGRTDIGAIEDTNLQLKAEIAQGQITLLVQNPRNESIIIQSTSDFVTWMNIHTNTTGSLHFNCEVPATNHLFLRAVTASE
ncbi:MAG: hypothetical protein SFY81_06115 [Verrucomicrobiota bacterium]|nr:hypothetical protein [Verrucomicrobiota bacterium]